MRRPVVLVAVAILAVAEGLIGQPLTALAWGDSSCPHGGNSTSSACFYGHTQYSDDVKFQNGVITLDQGQEANGNHVNNTLWTYSGSPCQLWIEQGVTQGYHGAIEYGYYWAENNSVTGYSDMFLGSASQDNSVHEYQNVYIGGSGGYGAYDLYRDSTLYVVANYLGFGTCIAQTGLESSLYPYPNGNFYSTLSFDDNPLKWEDSGGVWHSGWNTSQWWIDDPCNHGYTTPYCFNGAWSGSAHWSANKN